MSNNILPIIGIVGGLGPQAGIDLANKIMDQTVSDSDQDHISIVLLSMPASVVDRTQYLVGEVSENPGIAIAGLVESLELFGVDVVGIPCNTAHAPSIFRVIRQSIDNRGSSVRLLDMVTETVGFIRRHYPNVERVGVLSTTGAIRAQIYPRALALQGLQAVLPDKDLQEHVLHPAIVSEEYGIKANANPVSARARRDLFQTAAYLVDAGAEVIISGCTEIPLAITESHIDETKIIDPTLILARALIRDVAPEKLAIIKDIL